MPPPNNLRFLHTSDWHLGQAYRNVEPDLADRLRAARLDAVSRLLAEAERLGLAFVLAAGDQFDGPMPEPALVRELLDRIAAHPGVAVHMIPGNHDPCMPGSAYERSAFKSRPGNLHFHHQPGPVRLAEHRATLFPCPCLDRYGDDPMAWIPPRSHDDGWRIGLAHGSLPSFASPGDRNYPILQEAPARLDLDYVALGDWHTANPDPWVRPGEAMYYCGAPEVGGWDETGAGHVLEVALTRGNGPRVVAHRVCGYDWRDLTPELHTGADLARLADELERLASATRLVRVCPTGSLTLADRHELDRCLTDRAPGFAALQLDPRGLRLAGDGDLDLPPDPLIREAYRRLARLAADPADGPPQTWPRDLPRPDAEAAGRALYRFRDLLP